MDGVLIIFLLFVVVVIAFLYKLKSEPNPMCLTGKQYEDNYRVPINSQQKSKFTYNSSAFYDNRNYLDPKFNCGEINFRSKSNGSNIVETIPHEFRSTSTPNGLHKQILKSPRTSNYIDRSYLTFRQTKEIAIDCEMVGVRVGVNNNMLARVSIVNGFGDCIYDTFVKPTETVEDYRTHVSGVRPQDLETGEDFNKVKNRVKDILNKRILIGHGLKNDFKVLHLTHQKKFTRDTALYPRFREGFLRTPSLKTLAKKYLNKTIQEGEHSSVEDAHVAMQLYKMFEQEWEIYVKNCLSKFKENISQISMNR